MTEDRVPTTGHAVYPGGPPCNPNCLGEHSMYHDGYADGYEAAEQPAPPLDVAGLFRVPFDRDYALVPDEADTWTEEQFDAFYAGVEAGIGVVRSRYENPDEWRRSSVKAGLGSEAP